MRTQTSHYGWVTCARVVLIEYRCRAHVHYPVPIPITHSSARERDKRRLGRFAVRPQRMRSRGGGGGLSSAYYYTCQTAAERAHNMRTHHIIYTYVYYI